MGKKLGDYRLWQVLPFEFSYDGDESRLAKGERVPEDYFLFQLKSDTLRFSLTSFLRDNPGCKRLFKRALGKANTGGEIAQILFDGRFLLTADEATREDLDHALRQLSTTHVQAIVGAVISDCFELPPSFPLWTFQEARAVMFAIANRPDVARSGWSDLGNSRKGWIAREGGFEVVFDLKDWVPDARGPELERRLKGHSLKAVLCWQVVLNAVLRSDDDVTIALGDLVKILRLPEKKGNTKNTRTVWEWLQNFDSMTVVGQRRHKVNNELVAIDDTLFHIVGGIQSPGSDPALVPPFAVTLRASPWLAKFRSNHSVLSNIGDLSKLLDLPTGKTSTSWALSMGLGLLQYWREKATRATLLRPGEDNRSAAQFAGITRRMLFDRFPPDLSPASVLEGSHPSDAQTYWKEAEKIIRERLRIVSSIGPRSDVWSRQGWEEQWLDEELDIRPTKEIAEDLSQIQRARRRIVSSSKKAKSKVPTKSRH
jgi:hypothetical protein